MNDKEGIRLLFVDDGSNDDTASTLENWMRGFQDDKIALLRLNHNLGKAEAVRAGILYSLKHFEQEFVGFWDADLATPLPAGFDFIAYLKSSEFDVVVGSRVKLCGRHILRQPARHYLGRVFATAASLVLGLAIYDTQCGAKLFRVNTTMRQGFALPFQSRWVFDVEILARFLQFYTTEELEYKVYEYPLEVWRDVSGSKVKATDFLKAIVEMISIQRRYMPAKKK